MNCAFIECSAKSNINIERIFQTTLVEIAKFENNVDLKQLGCKKIFECFVKHEKSLIIFLYIFITLNLVRINV